MSSNSGNREDLSEKNDGASGLAVTEDTIISKLRRFSHAFPGTVSVVVGGFSVLVTFLTIDDFAYNRALSEVKSEIYGPDGPVAELGEKLAKATNDASDQRAIADRLTVTLANKEDELAQSAEGLVKALAENSALDFKLSELEVALSESVSAPQTAQKEALDYATKNEELEKELVELRKSMSSNLVDLSSCKDQTLEASARVKELESELASAQSSDCPAAAPNGGGVELLPTAECIPVNQRFTIRQNASAENCETASIITLVGRWTSGRADSMTVAARGRDHRMDLGSFESISNTCSVQYIRMISDEPEASIEMRFQCD